MVGSVIPGSTIILALSALVPGGELKLQWVLAAAIAGALLGDGSAFWIGHRAQREILNAWPLTNYPRVVAQSEAFFRRWGTLGGVLRPLRAADPRLRAGHRRRARHAAVAILCGQHSGHPGLGAGPCAAGRAGGVRARAAMGCCRHHRRQRQAFLDADRDRRRPDPGARGLDHPPPQRRWRASSRQGRPSNPSTCRQNARAMGRPNRVPAPVRHTVRAAGSAGRAAIARWHARSIRRCAPWQTSVSSLPAGSRRLAPARRGRNRC